MLRNGIAGLAEGKIGLLLRVPSDPCGETLAVGVAGLCEVGPVGLDGICELVVGCIERQPVEGASLECAEDVGDFERVECAKLGLSFARGRNGPNR